jgi:mannose-6-phosphate isomerase-like protein (cupin superfamily)
MHVVGIGIPTDFHSSNVRSYQQFTHKEGNMNTAQTNTQIEFLPDVQADVFLGGMENMLVDENEQTGVAHLIQAVPPGLGAPILHLHRSDEESFLVLDGELTVYYETPEEKRSQTLSRHGRVRIPAGTAHGVMNQGKENAILLVTFKVIGKPITKGFHRWFPRAAACGENIPAAFQLAIEEYDSAFVEQPGGHQS